MVSYGGGQGSISVVPVHGTLGNCGFLRCNGIELFVARCHKECVAYACDIRQVNNSAEDAYMACVVPVCACLVGSGTG
jgi:hypothetical protein